ncbi:MAG TPA: hypothetical protein DCM05_04520 [Elusimicrobia bacterium]|nr:hypothetical protein [Elusimicrobiota bacterium]
MFYGLNYWPRSRAMYFWDDFRAEEVREDFDRFARDGFNHLRVTLSWEAFQPKRGEPAPQALRDLETLVGLAEERGLQLTLALFMGHMSGATFVPPWLLAGPGRRGRLCDPRFQVVTAGKVLRPRPLLDIWTDRRVLESQRILVKSVLEAVGHSRALYAVDLGNESDNVLPPARTQDATRWFRALSRYVKRISPALKVTLGFHGENLFQVKRLSIAEIAPDCDFVSFHPYPNYTDWMDDPLDTDFFPFMIAFLRRLTGKPVFIQEFGLPVPARQKPRTRVVRFQRVPGSSRPLEKQRLFNRRAYGEFVWSALRKSRIAGNLGMLLWCSYDYGPALSGLAPLDTALHERHFGFYDQDGDRKIRRWDLERLLRTPLLPARIPPFGKLIALYRDQDALESCPVERRTALWREAFTRFCRREK